MGWNEAELLAWLRRRPRPAVLRGSQGHDAAVLARARGLPVVCADQVVEGVHAPSGCPGRILGRKAAGRALSDLAATAARPRALLLCIAAPRDAASARLRAVIRGVEEKAQEHGAALVGGDLSEAPGPLRLAVTALGDLASRRAPPGRDRARPGDLVLLSGPVGGSRLGRHMDPLPRLALGAFLHARGARVLMDVSDGLALDLSRIARASGVRIDLERVPLHADAVRLARRGRASAREHALGDGEDHELLALLAPRTWRSIAGEAQRRFPGLSVVGRARVGGGLWIAEEERPGAGQARPAAGRPRLRRWSGRGGWVHGT